MAIIYIIQEIKNYYTWKLFMVLLTDKISLKSVTCGASVKFFGESGSSNGPNLLSSMCTFSSISAVIYI